MTYFFQNEILYKNVLFRVQTQIMYSIIVDLIVVVVCHMDFLKHLRIKFSITEYNNNAVVYNFFIDLSI